MKKFVTLLMAMLMVMPMAACNGNDTAGDTNPSNNSNSSVEEATSESTTNSDTNSDTNAGTTVGEALLADFKADSTGTAQEIADRLITNDVIQFMGAAMPVEEGLLSGFDNTEIKGFKEGVMFAPMMSSIAFVGYIFELPEDADVEAFKTTLKDSANLRWNVCVEAEELIVESEGNKVFFLMCPKHFEQIEVTEDGEVLDIPYEPEQSEVTDDMIPAEDGITLE